MFMPDPPSRPSVTQRPQVLLADNGFEQCEWLCPALTTTGAEVRLVSSGNELEEALQHSGPFDLVVTPANLADHTGLRVLARMRAVGVRAPFIIVLSGRRSMLRVMVSEVTGEPLSNRVVDEANLVALSSALMRPGARAPA